MQAWCVVCSAAAGHSPRISRGLVARVWERPSVWRFDEGGAKACPRHVVTAATRHTATAVSPVAVGRV